MYDLPATFYVHLKNFRYFWSLPQDLSGRLSWWKHISLCLIVQVKCDSPFRLRQSWVCWSLEASQTSATLRHSFKLSSKEVTRLVASVQCADKVVTTIVYANCGPTIMMLITNRKKNTLFPVTQPGILETCWSVGAWEVATPIKTELDMQLASKLVLALLVTDSCWPHPLTFGNWVTVSVS